MASDFQSFGARMRHERERRRISIASIAESTKILGALIEGLENDDLSRWPTGLYRRAFMRAYARAIGLDQDATVKEFLEHHPDPEATPTAPVTDAPSTSGLAYMLRIGAPPLGAWFSDGALISGFRWRCLAALLDLFVIAATGLAAFVVLGHLWAPLAVAATAYYGAGILLLGNTPGVCLFADPTKAIGGGRPMSLTLRMPRRLSALTERLQSRWLRAESR